MKFRHIAVEGPIGVGKTTLAAQLAEAFNARLLQDPDGDNPFLARFYQQPEKLALHTQLHFLLARLELLNNPAVRQPAGPIVTDFMLAKDRIFAELALDELEWDMYSKLYHHAVPEDLPHPDLVIYLQAPLAKLLERIERRGKRNESRIRRPYLTRLIELYERFFHNYTESALLIVNAAEINLADSVLDRTDLIERIRAIEGGRHYVNPSVASV